MLGLFFNEFLLFQRQIGHLSNFYDSVEVHFMQVLDRYRNDKSEIYPFCCTRKGAK